MRIASSSGNALFSPRLGRSMVTRSVSNNSNTVFINGRPGRTQSIRPHPPALVSRDRQDIEALRSTRAEMGHLLIRQSPSHKSPGMKVIGPTSNRWVLGTHLSKPPQSVLGIPTRHMSLRVATPIMAPTSITSKYKLTIITSRIPAGILTIFPITRHYRQMCGLYHLLIPPLAATTLPIDGTLGFNMRLAVQLDPLVPSHPSRLAFTHPTTLLELSQQPSISMEISLGCPVFAAKVFQMSSQPAVPISTIPSRQ